MEPLFTTERALRPHSQPTRPGDPCSPERGELMPSVWDGSGTWRVPKYGNWGGHSTERKGKRKASLPSTPAPASLTDQTHSSLHLALTLCFSRPWCPTFSESRPQLQNRCFSSLITAHILESRTSPGQSPSKNLPLPA